MLDIVIQGIGSRLDAVFGEEYKIYKNDIRQGFKEPCFFVLPVAPSREQELGSREHRTYPFDIVYTPKVSSRDELYAVAELLMRNLCIIEAGKLGLLRGKELSYEVIDGQLHFLVSYDFSLVAVGQTDEFMENLDLRGDI